MQNTISNNAAKFIRKCVVAKLHFVFVVIYKHISSFFLLKQRNQTAPTLQDSWHHRKVQNRPWNLLSYFIQVVYGGRRCKKHGKGSEQWMNTRTIALVTVSWRWNWFTFTNASLLTTTGNH